MKSRLPIRIFDLFDVSVIFDNKKRRAMNHFQLLQILNVYKREDEPKSNVHNKTIISLRINSNVA